MGADQLPVKAGYYVGYGKPPADHYATAVEYKTGWEDAIQQARERELPEPQPIPHPDDVIINARTAEVHYCGPITPEEKKRWDRALEFRDDQQREVTYLANSYRDAARAKKPNTERLGEAQWSRFSTRGAARLELCYPPADFAAL